MSDLFVPKPEDWTIRLKNGKSTIFLHIDPEDLILELKQNLLNVLENLPSSSMLIESLGRVPSDPKDIVFGLPVDKNELEEGWVDQVISRSGPSDSSENGADSEVEENNILNRSCRSAGLRDGAVMAFRFKNGQQIERGDWGVKIPKLSDEDDENDDDMKGVVDSQQDHDEHMQDGK